MKQVLWVLTLIFFLSSIGASAKSVEGDVIFQDRSGRVESESGAVVAESSDFRTGCRKFFSDLWCGCVALGKCPQAELKLENQQVFVSFLGYLQEKQHYVQPEREAAKLLNSDDRGKVYQTLTQVHGLKPHQATRLIEAYNSLYKSETARSGRQAVPDALKAETQATN